MFAEILDSLAAGPPEKIDEYFFLMLAGATSIPPADVANAEQADSARMNLTERALRCAQVFGLGDDLKLACREFRARFEGVLRSLAEGGTVDLSVIDGAFTENPKATRDLLLWVLQACQGDSFAELVKATALDIAESLRSSKEIRAATELMLRRAGFGYDEPELNRAFTEFTQHARNTWGPNTAPSDCTCRKPVSPVKAPAMIGSRSQTFTPWPSTCPWRSGYGTIRVKLSTPFSRTA